MAPIAIEIRSKCHQMVMGIGFLESPWGSSLPVRGGDGRGKKFPGWDRGGDGDRFEVRGSRTGISLSGLEWD
ncbi:hypothetical protein Droror1_Dr00017355 [Drosera rotundifolia]